MYFCGGVCQRKRIMAKIIRVQGYDAYKTAAKENAGKTLFALFTGSHGEDGKSWCPDCVTADPVVEASLSKLPADAVFIHCGVGDRDFWKDQSNVFRKDADLRLKSVPTLMKLGQPNRLEEEQCAKADLVEMLFVDD
ncbi:thioredoxin domain-containing protein 17-like [Mercenaria mercenaria]|uniref:thioredoxin domain-containing protein 17-like n=1 Tax=Mercenaria mercenaria TaxID=6596 RepID=UPI00234F2281|nr:thioredoxin domain-containing protein 17-like [Mercenaria mercenaria]